MTRTIREWQRASYELAKAKGFHNCGTCEGAGTHTVIDQMGLADPERCSTCNGTGLCDPHSPTRIASRLALIHCEISEAVECVARGRMGVYTQVSESRITESRYAQLRQEELTLENVRGLKLEGFPIELADVFLRLCDLAESLGVEGLHFSQDRPNASRLDDPERISAELNTLHMRVAQVLPRTAAKSSLQGVFNQLAQVCAYTNVDLLTMAEIKHSYNKTRPIRHGGKTI